MPYARTNWTMAEVSRLTQNPVHSASGPHAHSGIHAVEDELHSNPLFQRMRVQNRVTETKPNGQIKSKWEVGAHSTLGNFEMSTAMVRVLNHRSMQPYLQQLDQRGGDLKVWVNFIQPIGNATLHRRAGSTQIPVRSLFVYMKSNPGNKDLPIFQTLVPHENHKPIGSVREPVIIVA